MTKEEFEDRMKVLSNINDKEIRHIEMDNLMIQVLYSLGYKEGCNIIMNTEKWYA